MSPKTLQCLNRSDGLSRCCSCIERLGNIARSLAYGRYAFNAARDYAVTRRQFSRLLCDFQGPQRKFADMAIKLESAQLLLYRAAVNADRGHGPRQS